jgi:hypothetical protein
MFGYDYDELIGIFGSDVIAPESKELVRRNIKESNQCGWGTIGRNCRTSPS